MNAYYTICKTSDSPVYVKKLELTISCQCFLEHACYESWWLKSNTYTYIYDNFKTAILLEICEILEKLEVLKFINAEIPEEIGNYKVIERLVVENNMLTGPIPWIIFNMSSFKTLGFTFNELSGSLPDQICPNLGVLKGLFLSGNKLSGPFPSKWSPCKELQFLSLSFNLFIGSIPTSIGNLTKLNFLYLANNNLTAGFYIYI